MQLFIVKQDTTWQALSARLAQPGAPATAALERLRALNPHLDKARLVSGSMLLLPDLPGMKGEQTQSVGGSAFEGFSAEVNNGLAYAAKRVRTGADAVAADRANVSGLLRGAAAKRVLEGDPQLKQQVDEADAQFKTDAARAQDAAKQVEAMQARATEALAALARLVS